jgi:hypothetical protein
VKANIYIVLPCSFSQEGFDPEKSVTTGERDLREFMWSKIVREGETNDGKRSY